MAAKSDRLLRSQGVPSLLGKGSKKSMKDERRHRCPICGESETRSFLVVDAMEYHRCGICRGTFLDERHRLERDAERGRYLLHQNDPCDPDYRRFLGRLTEPLLERLLPGLRGLDYGCGPGPALAAMMEEAGYPMRLYDPIFFPDEQALEETYDFITCTEAVEHFYHPLEEFVRLDGMLRPGGILALMTSFQEDDEAFAQWHYRREISHVVFYRAETFRFIADRHGWFWEIPVKNVVFLKKRYRAIF